MPFVESRQEFAERHSDGGEPVAVGGWLLFPDGAAMEAQDWTGYATRREPPPDDHERAALIHDYWKARADAAAAAFESFKADLATGTGYRLQNGDAPALDLLPELKRLRDAARKLRKRADAAAAEEERTIPEPVKRAERARAANRAACEQFRSEINNVKL